MIIELPRPPSVNGLYRNVRGKGRAKTKRYLTWIRAAKNQINAQRPLERVSGHFKVDIQIAPGRGDIDNRIKAVVDILVAVDLVDDDRNMRRVAISDTGLDPRGCLVKVEAA